MDWKSILKMVLSIALPVVYSAIKAQNPSLPIMENEFIELVMWIVAASVGGWEMMKMRVNAALKRQDSSYEKLVAK